MKPYATREAQMREYPADNTTRSRARRIEKTIARRIWRRRLLRIMKNETSAP